MYSPVVTVPLSKAIVGGDVEQAKILIENGEDLNKPDPRDNGNTPLHVTVMVSNLSILKLLLSHKDIDVNRQNYDGDTALLISLRMKRPPSFVMLLIDAGCDVRISNNLQVSAIHLATSEYKGILYDLLKRCLVDVNQQDRLQWSPLNYAIGHCSDEIACMLLYYGADANTTCISNMTPFMYGLGSGRTHGFIKVILEHTSDLSMANSLGSTALILALKATSPMIHSIVKKGADVNYVTPQGESTLLFTLRHCNSEYFKLLWAKLDARSLLKSSTPFLVSYVRQCNFRQSVDWLECLWTILDCSTAVDLVKQSDSVRATRARNEGGFVTDLMRTLKIRQINADDRISVLNMCLSYGAEVDVADIIFATTYFGYKQEFEALIYACEEIENFQYITHPLFMYRLVIEEETTFKSTCRMFIKLINDETVVDDFIYTLRFFSFPLYIKKELFAACKASAKVEYSDNGNIVKEIMETPELPSLLELSRNHSRTFIKRAYKVKKPYQFYTAVRDLVLPKRIADLILFRIPLR